MKVATSVLICHHHEPLNHIALARWLASFTDLAAGWQAVFFGAVALLPPGCAVLLSGKSPASPGWQPHGESQ
jgi:hypothetical protein